MVECFKFTHVKFTTDDDGRSSSYHQFAPPVSLQSGNLPPSNVCIFRLWISHCAGNLSTCSILFEWNPEIPCWSDPGQDHDRHASCSSGRNGTAHNGSHPGAEGPQCAHPPLSLKQNDASSAIPWWPMGFNHVMFRIPSCCGFRWGTTCWVLLWFSAPTHLKHFLVISIIKQQS